MNPMVLEYKPTDFIKRKFPFTGGLQVTEVDVPPSATMEGVYELLKRKVPKLAGALHKFLANSTTISLDEKIGDIILGPSNCIVVSISQRPPMKPPSPAQESSNIPSSFLSHPGSPTQFLY